MKYNNFNSNGVTDMVIMFLNCANRKIADAINDYVVSSGCTIDVIILAEAKNISSIEGFKFSFMSEYKFGLHIFSKIDFYIDEIPYIIENKMIGINNDMHRLRVVSISLTNGLKILATHVDYGWYNPFAMRAIEEYLNKNSSCIDVIIGDFNGGYIEDSLDISTGGLVFHAGYLYFNRYENLGFVDPLKGKNEFTFISQRSKRRFRIDHCFIKNTDHSVRYIDYFLNKCISDHKAILVTI